MMAQIQEEKDRLNLSPKKFNMWLFILTSFMLFAAFTSEESNISVVSFSAKSPKANRRFLIIGITEEAAPL